MPKKKNDYIEVNDEGQVVSKADTIYNSMKQIIQDKFNTIKDKLSDVENPKSFSMLYSKLMANAQSYVRTSLFGVTNKFPLLTNNEVFDLTSEELLAIYQNFVSLITMISDTLEAPFNFDKAMFCEYAGITLSQYDALIRDGSEDVRSAMERIDAFLYSSKQSASEEGILQGKSVSVGVATKHFGHSAVVATPVDTLIEDVKTGNSKVTDRQLLTIQNMFKLENKK
jgi:hypothetical protein